MADSEQNILASKTAKAEEIKEFAVKLCGYECAFDESGEEEEINIYDLPAYNFSQSESD